VKIKILLCVSLFALTISPVLPLRAEEPIIPPSLAKIWPVGMERGSTATFTLDGRNLSGAKAVIFDAPGITAKISQITDLPEEEATRKFSTVAAVPLAKKQSALLEITVAKDVPPDVYRFRVQTPLGTTNMVPVAIGSLPEVKKSEKSGNAALSQPVVLPATMVGTITAPGDRDRYEFDGKTGEDVVFEVVASKLGSRIESLLALSDSSGRVLAEAGRHDNSPDAALNYRLPQDGKYTLTISDREGSGGKDDYYRVDAGALPYITRYFPLGVRAGETTTVAVEGVNLGGIRELKIEAPKQAAGWKTVPITLKENAALPLNKVRLVVGDLPEIVEQEPNNSLAQAEAVSFPVTINGHIHGGAKPGEASDEDYFRFHAGKGQQLTIDVEAARVGSPLDSVIEVLDAQGNAIPRATIRCLNQTTTTLSDRDSRTTGVRLTSTTGLHVNDYLMIGDELNQLEYISDQPDADVELKGINDLRLAFLGTSPVVHAVNTPVYRAQILPPDAEFPPNGLPVFHLTWRNDDGGPGYAADSRIDFVAPSDGQYILHLKDVRGLGGPDFAYRLSIRETVPDYQLTATPENPNIPKGGRIPLTVSVDRLQGYEGPIEIDVKGLPAGVTAGPAKISAGEDSTVVVLSASADASVDAPPGTMEIVGRATINGRDVARSANLNAMLDADLHPELSLQLATIIPPPDVVVTTDTRQVSLEPGQQVTVTLHVERQNGYKGRVPCYVKNLPRGVQVVNIGLNGVLVTETQTSRTFTLRAEDWAKPIEQPIYVVAEVESDSSTNHASPPLELKVTEHKQAASAGGSQAASVN
jgi:hypothetical protein